MNTRLKILDFSLGHCSITEGSKGRIRVRCGFRNIFLATLWRVVQKGRLRLGAQGKEGKGPEW